MAFVSVTRLRLRSFRYFPGFFFANQASIKQLVATAGFLGGKELMDKHFTFWTLTVWNDAEAMKLFRNGTAHRKAMQRLPYWCDEAAYTHWQQESNEIPSWEQAYQKLMSEGKSTKVRHPSNQHLNKTFDAPKWKRTERIFKTQ